MPCDQIILNRVKIEAANLDLLTLALETLVAQGKWARSNRESVRQEVERIIRQGFVSLPAGQEHLADRIKQEYSRQAVMAASRKFGWRVQEKTPQKLTVTRRV